MFWYTSTGWMMWNYLVSSLLLDSTIVLYEGDPFYPDGNALWSPRRRDRDDLPRRQRGVRGRPR